MDKDAEDATTRQISWQLNYRPVCLPVDSDAEESEPELSLMHLEISARGILERVPLVVVPDLDAIRDVEAIVRGRL